MLLHCAAVAYSRSFGGIAPDSRYLDGVTLGLAVNLASLTRLSFTSNYLKLADMGWLMTIFIALCIPATGSVWEECAKRARDASYQSECVHRFLSGDRRAIYDQFPTHIPSARPESLETYLTDSRMVSLLPPPWSPVVVNLSGPPERARGFAVGAVDPSGRPGARLQTVSDFPPTQEKGRRQWRSETFDALPSGWLLWEVCGYPNVRGDIKLNHLRSRQIPIALPRNPGNEWQEVATRAPRWTWRIDLAQSSGDSWFALRGPWKIGGGTACLVLICLHLTGITGGFVLILLIQTIWALDKKRLHCGNTRTDTSVAKGDAIKERRFTADAPPASDNRPG